MRDQLAPDGLLSLSFYVGQPWIGKKIFEMTREAFAMGRSSSPIPPAATGATGRPS